jgi:hypothetical protein
MSANMARLLPDPDSPTMPRIPPGSTESETPSTAYRGPTVEGKLTERSSILSRAVGVLTA